MKRLLALLLFSVQALAQDYTILPYSNCWAATTQTTADLRWDPLLWPGATHYTIWQFVNTPGFYGTQPKVIAKVTEEHLYLEGLRPGRKFKVYISKNDDHIGNGKQCLFVTKTL